MENTSSPISATRPNGGSTASSSIPVGGPASAGSASMRSQSGRSMGESSTRQHTGNEALAEAFRKLVQDGEELLHATTQYSSESLLGARERFQENLEQARHKLGEASSALREKAGVASEATREYVANNPWKALTIAALAGVVAGMLLRTGSRD